MFKAECLPILIGSLPINDHQEAVELILDRAPEIPLWPQLPKNAGEGMVHQFISGFPGLKGNESSCYIDTYSDDFAEQMTFFYQEYIDISENPALLEDSRFALGEESTRGLTLFLDEVARRNHRGKTLKGQITGPVTTGIGIKDQSGRSIFYDDTLRDMLVKMLSLKARWQVRKMRKFTEPAPPIIFIDEPGIVSFGSSAFVGITKEMVSTAVAEVIDGIKADGGLAGVHICANGDWSPVLESAADIISFDAYFYFDNFILYKEMLTRYLQRGGILAWGIVPTSDPEILERIDSAELFTLLQTQVNTIAAFGFSTHQILSQTLIAPSCGTGSLPYDLAKKVISLTTEVSALAKGLF